MNIECKSNLMYNNNVDRFATEKADSDRPATLIHRINTSEVFMVKKVCPVCGKEFVSNRSALSNRDKYCSKECSYKSRIKDLTGQQFGRLTVIEYRGSNQKTGSLWLCKCECGNEKIITSRNLLNGTCKSCGCYSKDNPSHRKHGLCNTKLHGVWTAMKSRCNNKNNKSYKTYGAKGIKVCNEWQDFENFYRWAMANGYQENAETLECTLDRIDVNGDYEPSNCRWVDWKTQQRNKSTARIVSYKDKNYSIGELAEMLGWNRKALWLKLKRNDWNTSILFENKVLPPKDEEE